MDVVAELVAPCRPEAIFEWVEDLARYPRWLEIVTRAEPIDGDAWAVDLRGALGPLARTKRLRMVRTELVAPRTVTFERSEVDGRDHSTWRLGTTVSEDPAGARLEMSLHYGGALFGPVLERVLRDEIERSKVRLLELVAAG